LPRLLPCSSTNFIRKLTKLGYTGPHAGGKHQFMTKAGGATVRVPNPHNGDISVDLLSRILKAANISHDDWTNA
jgi:predicted RNA binding protein YcfA (HicA-like mRNA interferase family)